LLLSAHCGRGQEKSDDRHQTRENDFVLKHAFIAYRESGSVIAPSETARFADNSTDGVILTAGAKRSSAAANY
jgi:hypothetical protein